MDNANGRLNWPIGSFSDFFLQKCLYQLWNSHYKWCIPPNKTIHAKRCFKSEFLNMMRKMTKLNYIMKFNFETTLWCDIYFKLKIHRGLFVEYLVLFQHS